MPTDLEELRRNLDADLTPVLRKYFPKDKVAGAASFAADTAIETFKAKQINRRVTNIDDYKGGNYMRIEKSASGGGFDSFGNFLSIVKSNPNDSRLKALAEGTPNLGGFLVPEPMLDQIMMGTVEQSIVKPRARVFQMTSETLRIPRINDTSHTSSLFGGITGTWVAEGGTMTDSQPDFGQVVLEANTLYGYTYASNELLQDAGVGLEQVLISAFSQAIAWYTEEAFIQGDGAGKPLGILNSPCLIEVSAETGQGASTIVAENVWGIYQRLMPGSSDRAVWLCNPGTKKQLYSMGLAVGAGGAAVYIPAGGMSQKPYDTLLGLPVFWTEHCSALGSKGDIILADLSYYIIGERKELSVEASPHVKFTTNQTCWRFVTRLDGSPYLGSALTPARGDSVSPFVTLSATRT